MRRTSSIFLYVYIIVLMAMAIWAPSAGAYPQWSGSPFGQCSTCHGNFLANGYVSRTSQDGVPWNIAGTSSLHNIHRDYMLPGGRPDCTSCHVVVDGTPAGTDNPLLDVSGGGATGNRTLSCIGCHGRAEDQAGGQFTGAGLRQHHTNGATGAFCGGCHSDNDPNTFTPVGEDIPPLNYTDTDISILGWDPCIVDVENPIFPTFPIIGALGLDNDGDLLYDGDDPDCGVNQPPTADPNGPYTGVVGVNVMFDGTGSIDPDGTIVSYDWDFGDGTTGTGAQPQHAYDIAGTFTVTLTVTDDAGATDTATTTATIDPANQAPTANPNGPYTGTVGVPLTFDGSGSIDPDGTIVSYDWDFGDGNIGTGVSPTHTYVTDGVFTVTLTVMDDGGLTDTASTTAEIGIGNQPPVADPNGPYTGTVGIAVQFDGSASVDPDGTIVSYDWDFGDGNTGAGVSPTHTYATDGTFNVTLTVTDDAGATDSAGTTATIVPANQPPVADPNGPYTGTAGTPVAFDGSGSIDPDGTIVSYDWDFGDGATGTGVSPTHTYATDGVFTVTLTVTDDAGSTDTATTTATIGTVNQPPVADPNGPYTGVVGVAVMFDGTGSIDPDGTIVSYDWDFGDGSTGTGPQPQHAYAAPGVYDVSLTVTDNAGDTSAPAMTTATIDPANQAPTADPNGPYTGTVGVPVTFDGSGSTDPDGTIVSYDWDFGDGATGTGVSPTHTYVTDGVFTVSLTVTDDGGLTDTATTTATIGLGNQPPTADPNGPYTGTVGVPVTFDGSGSTDPDGTIVSYDWDFGDGNTGTGVSPTHTYTAAGIYNVTLTVTDDAGATDSAMTTATIDPAGLIQAEIEVPGSINGANRGRTPVEIEFDDGNGMQVEIAELRCGGNVSNAMATPVRINAGDDEENEFTALFNTRDLQLVCEDTEIVCTGTLADGRSFEGMDEIRVIRDFEGNRCPR